MPYPAGAIANEFIKIARENHKRLSPLKLQKLVYFAHGWYLALTGKPLINEPVEAWKFGPVIPSLYHALKKYAYQSVNECMTDDDFWEPSTGGVCHELSVDDGPDQQENELAKRIVRRVWDVYGGFSATQLSNLTHDDGTPWSMTPDKDKRRNAIIDPEIIRGYFKAQADKSLAQANRDRQPVG